MFACVRLCARVLCGRAFLRQLRLRVEASGGLTHGVLRPPSGAGRFEDLDQVRMLSLLESRESVLANHTLFNQAMFRPEQSANPQTGGTRNLDAAWRGANGLRGLQYEARSRAERPLSPDCTRLHVCVQLGGGQRHAAGAGAPG